MARQIGAPVVDMLARLSPASVIPSGDGDFYQRAITAWRPPAAGDGDPDSADASAAATARATGAAANGPGPSGPRRGFGRPVLDDGVEPRPGIPHGHGRTGARRLALGDTGGARPRQRRLSHRLSGPRPHLRPLDHRRDVDRGLPGRRLGSGRRANLEAGPRPGRHTTLVKLEDAVHDVTLSRRDVRERAFGEIARFVRAYVLGRNGPETARRFDGVGAPKARPARERR